MAITTESHRAIVGRDLDNRQHQRQAQRQTQRETHRQAQREARHGRPRKQR